MKKNKIFIASLSTLILVLSSCGVHSVPVQPSSSITSISSSSMEDSSSSEEEIQGEALTFAKTISKYSNLGYKEILEACSLKGDEKMTKPIVLDMLYKSFSDLEAADSGLYKIAFSSGDYDLNIDDVSETIKEEYLFFYNRTLLGKDDPFSILDDDLYERKIDLEGNVTYDELISFLRRIVAYKGDSLKDDFYSYVNHDGMWNASGIEMNMGNTNLATVQMHDYIESMSPTDPRKIAIDNFDSTLFDDTVKLADLGGIKEYVSDICKASSFAELSTVLKKIYDSSRFIPVFQSLDVDQLDKTSNKYDAIFSINDIFQSVYNQGDIEKYSEYKILKLVFDYLEISDSISSYMDEYIAVNNELVQYKKDNKLINKAGKLDGNAKFGDCNFYNWIVDSGADKDHIYVQYLDYYKKMVKSLSGSFKAAKVYAICSLINQYPACLTSGQREEVSISYTTDSFLYGTGSSYYSSYLPYISGDFTYSFSKSEEYPKLYERIINCLDKVKAGAKEIFQNNTWLSESDKAKVIEKLDAIEYTVLGGENPDNSPITIHDYKNISDGGTVYYNLSLYEKAEFDNKLKCSGDGDVNMISYFMPYVTVNAFNETTLNRIAFLPGFLFSLPNYMNLSDEELYVEIGFVLGHEFMHSFDANGFPYDKNGDYNPNWLSTDAQNKFSEKNQKVADFYSQFEEYPLNKMNGKVKCMEGLADILGFNATVIAAKTIEGFDFDKFYKCFANFMLTNISSFGYLLSFKNDVHPVGYGRCNTVLMNSKDFREFYGIQEGDLMYLSDEDFVSVY